MREFSFPSFRLCTTSSLALWLSLLCSTETAQAQSTLKRCEPDVTIVRHEQGLCNMAIPPVPTGFMVERLHGCSTVAHFAATGMTNGVPLKQRLESTFVVTKVCSTSPCSITSTDLGLLESFGYTEAEPSCGMAAQGDDTPSASGSSFSNLGSYADLTGAAEAVPAAAQLLCPTGVKCPLVRVAVLDSGIDALALPELDNGVRAWAAPDICHPQDNTCVEEDLLGHGTAVADLLVKSAGGLVELSSIKILDETGSGTMRGLARGLLVAAGDHQAQLLNLSLAWPGGSRAGEDMPVYMAEAFSALYQIGARAVAAAGNRSHIANATYQYFYPAAAAHQQGDLPLGIIAVSGLNASRNASSQAVGQLKSSFPIDIWAPSELICSRTSRLAYTEGTMRVSGTSLAAPQVAGSLALLLVAEQELGTLGMQAYEATEPLDVLLPMLTTGSDRRMNVCQAVNAMLGYDTGCGVKSYVSTSASDGCELPMRDQVLESYPVSFQSSIQQTGYPSSSGITRSGQLIKPVDQTTNTTWSSQVSSAPAIPVCTSCDYCPSLASLRVGWANAGYSNYQLRLTVGGSYVYYSVTGLNNLMSAFNTSSGPVPVQSQFSFSSLVNYGSATEPWLIAQDQSTSAWSGQPLKPGC